MEKYYFHGIEMIILTMDVPAYVTLLRVIPHVKRGKIDRISQAVATADMKTSQSKTLLLLLLLLPLGLHF